MEWKDIAAVGGLFLGTLNLWLLVFRQRPFLFIEPLPPPKFVMGNIPRFRVRIVNPSQVPVQISRLSIRGIGRKSDLYMFSTDEAGLTDKNAAPRWEAYNLKGVFRDFIPGNDTRYYTIDGLPEKHWLILIFWWHRNGFLLLRLPMPLVLSSRQLATLKNEF
jgi:hypothetical protein